MPSPPRLCRKPPPLCPPHLLLLRSLAQPQQPTGTESSFVVPQRGEAAHLQVSTSVGNSASAPISSPPSAAKADPNTMNLAAMQAEPVEPYCYPSLNLFNATRPDDEAGAAREMKKNADILVNTLDSFGVKTTMLDICRGPSVTRYELQPQAGIKVSRITSLADDIALNLATAGVRIEAPIPGKPAVGIEVPNKIRSTVNIRAVFESQNYINMRSPLTMALGKDIAGAAQVADLCKMPHLLIAGSTGSGKSVCVNSIIISFLFRSSPEDVKLILIDPKVVELAEYNGIPHLLMPVVTEPRKAAGRPWRQRCRDGAPLQAVCREQRPRDQSLQQAGRPDRAGASALHCHRYRRVGRFDDGRRQRGRRLHLPHRAEGPCRRYPPDRCYSASSAWTSSPA